MILKGYADDQPQTYNCNLYQGNTNATLSKTVEKKNTNPCSDGNVLKHGGVILLLAVVFPLLSGMLKSQELCVKSKTKTRARL
ncbi:hypothetical protein Q7C36_022648 [Tachysurus vachellii]|uniref:Uncharacterized protein n=1 Tax=Tachysurus vachellii TaxID=175792 RepID=A0AA88LP07_TACVA|nr:hypothetical protein Q7C36_022648 [Tachysurus vachellii]